MSSFTCVFTKYINYIHSKTEFISKTLQTAGGRVFMRICTSINGMRCRLQIVCIFNILFFFYFITYILYKVWFQHKYMHFAWDTPHIKLSASFSFSVKTRKFLKSWLLVTVILVSKAYTYLLMMINKMHA